MLFFGFLVPLMRRPYTVCNTVQGFYEGLQSRDNKPETNSLLEPVAPFSEEIKIRTFSEVSRLTGCARIVITVKVVRLQNSYCSH